MTDWDLSCPDWQERIRDGRSLVPNLPLDRQRAARAVAIFNKLRIPDVPGTPTFAEAGGDWFREIVAALHGSFDVTTRQRTIRELMLLIPKKNSKTTNGAGLMMTSLLMNDRPRAEFLLVAPTQEVALLAFNQIAGMIDLEPAFTQGAGMFHVQSHLKKVTLRKSGATLQIKSFDTKVMTGVKPSGVLIDELHVIAQSPDADRVIGQIRGGIVSQPEGFFFFTTTQSERPPRGVFRAELDKARAIRDGRATGKMLPILYEFPRDIAEARKAPDMPYAWEDSSLWHMVTPNNGRSITVERLVEDYDTAKLASEEELRRWASQHLNVEIGMALRADRWAGAERWEMQADPEISLDAILDRCDVVTIGVDGGGLDDLLGLAVLGRDSETRHWLLWVHAWAHKIVLERRKGEASNLRDFEKQGDLTVVDDMGQAFTEVADLIERVNRAGLLSKVGFDPVGVGLIVDELSRRGINQAGGQVEGVSQGYKLTGTIKTTEVQISDGNLVHPGQPLMAWCVSNAKVEPKGNAIVITKQASGSGKIDPLMATFNAVALMALNPEPINKRSVYETRGIMMV